MLNGVGMFVGAWKFDAPNLRLETMILQFRRVCKATATLPGCGVALQKQ